MATSDWRLDSEWIKNCNCAFGCPCDFNALQTHGYSLLFVSGIMNLVWIAAVAIYVAFENLLPRSRWLSRAAGIALIVSGAVVFARSLAA